MMRRLHVLLVAALVLPAPTVRPACADPAPHWHSVSGDLADGRTYCALKVDAPGQATLALRYDAGSALPTLSLSVVAWPVQVDRPTLSFDRTGSFVPVGDPGPVGMMAPISMADLGRFLDPDQTVTISTPQWPTQAVRIDMQPGDEAIQNFRLCVQLHQPAAAPGNG
nr:hypothetical protein [uncultured Lichenicoccus sp.]